MMSLVRGYWNEIRHEKDIVSKIVRVKVRKRRYEVKCLEKAID